MGSTCSFREIGVVAVLNMSLVNVPLLLSEGIHNYKLSNTSRLSTTTIGIRITWIMAGSSFFSYSNFWAFYHQSCFRLFVFKCEESVKQDKINKQNLGSWLTTLRWRDRSECLLSKKGNTQAIFSAFFFPSYKPFVLSQDCSDNVGLFVVSYIILGWFTALLPQASHVGILTGVELNLCMAWVLNILIILSLLIPWKWNRFPFTCILLNFFNDVFQLHDIFAPLLSNVNLLSLAFMILYCKYWLFSLFSF